MANRAGRKRAARHRNNSARPLEEIDLAETRVATHDSNPGSTTISSNGAQIAVPDALLVIAEAKQAAEDAVNSAVSDAITAISAAISTAKVTVQGAVDTAASDATDAISTAKRIAQHAITAAASDTTNSVSYAERISAWDAIEAASSDATQTISAAKFAALAAVNTAAENSISAPPKAGTEPQSSNYLEWTLKIIAGLVGLVGLYSIYNYVFSEKTSECTIAISQWQALMTYYDHCAGLSQDKLTQNCTKILSTDVPPPPDCKKEHKVEVAKMNKKRSWALHQKIVDLIPNFLSNLGSDIIIERDGPGEYYASGYGMMDFTDKHRLRRDCSTRWEFCMKGDWVPSVHMSHYAACFNGCKAQKNTYLIIDHSEHHLITEFERFSIGCDEVLRHYLPEAPFFIPSMPNGSAKAKDDVGIQQMCDYDYKRCSASMHNKVVPRSIFTQEVDFFSLHSIQPDSPRNAVKISKRMLDLH